MLIVSILLLSSILVSHASIIVRDTLSETYSWKTGSWSACDRHAKCGEGLKIRRILCVKAAGFIVPNSNCDESVRPSTTKQCFTVCENHKFDLRWKIGHWSPCIFNSSSDCTATSSLVGEARRSVECVLSSTHLIVDDEACGYFWDRPDSEMVCSLDCPQKCVTSKTNVTCYVEECSEKISWTEEVNNIIVAPSDENESCTSIVKEPVCKKERFIDTCKNTQEMKQYKVKISTWSTCTNEMDELEETSEEIQIPLRPVIGISKRNITCIDENGAETDLSFCNLKHSPPLLRQCVVPVHCVVSPWSEWHVEDEGCVTSKGRVHPETRTRKRTLLQLPVGVGAAPCPPLFEERSVRIGLPLCNRYQWYPLEWTDCQVMVHGDHGQVTVLKPTCGSGLQYRNLTCLKMMDMIPVDSVLCHDVQPDTVQRCKLLCKRDCQVSHWARWGPCTPHNNTNFLDPFESGYRRRVRSVLVGPDNDGRPCPHLEEVDTCNKVEVFNWQYGNWSECQLSDPHKRCGTGEKTRDYSCVNYNGVPLKDDFMCDHHIPLMDYTDTCRVPCPNDCIMSDWSDWSECSMPCSSNGDGGYVYSNRTVLAIPGYEGKNCTKKTKQSKECNLNNCRLYKWTTSEWGPCIPGRSNEILSSSMVGEQKRTIKCKLGSKPAKSLQMCNYMKKPEEERRCSIPSPVNCITSNFTEWTNCDKNCYSDAVQYRHRIILQSSKHGGTPCPEALVEARPCSSSLDPNCLVSVSSRRRNVTYHWHNSHWSNCHLPLSDQTCGMGFQIRNVTCQNVAEKAVEAHNCLPSNWTRLPDGPMNAVPVGLRSCEVVCSSMCTVSAWSAWAKCSYAYEDRRYRRRELVGSNLTNEDCLQKIKLVEEEKCPVIPGNLTDSMDDQWMSCIVEGDNRTTVAINGQLISHDCGMGYRNKVGLQMNSESDIEPGLERDFCYMECPRDCQMSSWSEWTECNVPCGQGFRERTRDVLVPANNRGRPCPVNRTEIQRDVCNIVCSDYHWMAGGWTECELEDPDSTCGIGTHYRSIRCWNKRTEREAEEERCDPLLKHLPVESCRIFCPGECVVSPWHVSKKCIEPCTNESYKELRRTVYRQPKATATPCPPLVTRMSCVLNSTCYHHKWDLGPWGSCVLPEGAHCGEGVTKKPLICVRSDGRQVDPIQCEKTHKSRSLFEPILKPCYTVCPVDCVMSEWSAWNKSSCSACGPIGIMTRTRHELQSPTDTGQPCPIEKEQRMPCDFKPCYHWMQSEWSHCDLEGAGCGYGVRRRVVECIRFDHLLVDKAHCLVVNVTFPINGWVDPAWLATAQEGSHEEELCYISCPGDCILTEWTNWNHCHKNCKIGQKVGYQTSSRQILFLGQSSSADSCSKQLWRKKPCWSDNCDMFAWKLRNNSFVCENKEGLVIKGGCTSEPRPCFSACEELGGICEGLTGICLCKDGKREKTILGPSSKKCKLVGKGPRPPANHSASTSEIRLQYYPDDSQVSFWMFAMISIGTAFVVFVAVTVYLMCRSSLRQRTVSVERQPSVRRRLNGAITEHSTLESSPEIRSHCSH